MSEFDVTLPVDSDKQVAPPEKHHVLGEGPTRRMTVAVFGVDPEGNLTPLGQPTYIHVPKGCRVLFRARAWGRDSGACMIPFEFDSERDWRKDDVDIVGVHEGPPRFGLWGDDE